MPSKRLLARSLLPGAFIWISGLLIFNHALAAEYWYDGDRRIPLRQARESLTGKHEANHPSGFAPFRARNLGPKIWADGRFYLCYPDDWNEQRIHALEADYRLTPTTTDRQPDGIRIYTESDPLAAIRLANKLYEETGVNCAAPVWQRPITSKNSQDLPPGDDPLFGLQWHLLNLGQGNGLSEADIDPLSAWQVTLGLGATIAILDDGLDLHHPDLIANLLPTGHYDFISRHPNPTGGKHGTAVAGIAAARGFNGLGGRGVAPAASLLGLRILDIPVGQLDDEVAIMGFQRAIEQADIINCSWGPPDDSAHAFEKPSPGLDLIIREGINSGRQGRGVIYVWAAGNGGPQDDSNLDGYANLRHTIAVSASTNLGRAAVYSESGANILVNAPSGGGTLNLVTTDQLGSAGYNSGREPRELADPDYTNSFSGTSGATPVVAGVAALMLSVNPDLNWREVQQLLAAGANRNDPDHDGWRQNSAGYWINEQYGFGRVNASNAVTLAGPRRESIRPEQQTIPLRAVVNRTIPDNDPTGILSSLRIRQNLRVEHVQVTVNIPDHTYWGDLSIFLTSPTGTEVRLVKSRFISAEARSLGYQDWAMTTPLFLGESSEGTWTLRVVDNQADDIGTLANWSLTVHGVSIPKIASELPIACDGYSLLDPTSPPIPATIRQGSSAQGTHFSAAVEATAHEDHLVMAAVNGETTIIEQFAVAFHERINGTESWYMRGEEGWSIWDGEIATLQGFTASSEQPAVLHMGRLEPGHYTVWNGYSANGDDIIYCHEPLILTIYPP